MKLFRAIPSSLASSPEALMYLVVVRVLEIRTKSVVDRHFHRMVRQSGEDRVDLVLNTPQTYDSMEDTSRSIFLNFLVPKLPAPEGPDLSKGILDATDREALPLDSLVAILCYAEVVRLCL